MRRGVRRQRGLPMVQGRFRFDQGCCGQHAATRQHNRHRIIAAQELRPLLEIAQTMTTHRHQFVARHQAGPMAGAVATHPFHHHHLAVLPQLQTGVVLV